MSIEEETRAGGSTTSGKTKNPGTRTRRHTRRSEDISFCGNFLVGEIHPLRKGNWGSIIHERNTKSVKETCKGGDKKSLSGKHFTPPELRARIMVCMPCRDRNRFRFRTRTKMRLRCGCKRISNLLTVHTCAVKALRHRWLTTAHVSSTNPSPS